MSTKVNNYTHAHINECPYPSRIWLNTFIWPKYDTIVDAAIIGIAECEEIRDFTDIWCAST